MQFCTIPSNFYFLPQSITALLVVLEVCFKGLGLSDCKWMHAICLIPSNSIVCCLNQLQGFWWSLQCASKVWGSPIATKCTQFAQSHQIALLAVWINYSAFSKPWILHLKFGDFWLQVNAYNSHDPILLLCLQPQSITAHLVVHAVCF